MNPLLAGIAVYLFAQFAIGVWLSRRIHSEDDYLIAGRSLGPGLTTFTVFATWFGAETCVSAAGLAYVNGLRGASAEPFGYGLCIILMGVVYAVPLWRMRMSTAGDFYRLRYSPAVERLAVMLLVPTSTFWAAAQIRAFGQVLAATSGFEVEVMIGFAAIVVILYTAVGGLLAVAWTDLVQGIVLVAGLGVVGVAVLTTVGPDTVLAIEPERLQLFGAGDSSLLETMELWAVPVLGSVIAAELITRVIAARSPRIARGATIAGGSAYVLVGLIPVSIGLVGAVAMPGLSHPEQILPLMARSYLPLGLYALFTGALVSAILSTVDSAMLVAGSLTSHNLILPLTRGWSERARIWMARGAVAALGLVAWLMAVRADTVYGLVETASAFGSAGIVVVLTLGLFTPLGGPASATAALLGGLAAWVIGAYLADVPYPFLMSLAVAAIAYLALAIVAPPHRQKKRGV